MPFSDGNELKDLVDLQALVEGGANLESALADAEKKEAGADPAMLAWLLSELRIGQEAILPGGVNPERVLAFRDALVPRLRALAFLRMQRP